MLKKLIFDYMANSDMSWPIYGGGSLDRTTTLSASENLRCPRRLWMEKRLPVPFAPAGDTEPDWGYAQRGHAVEAWVVECLEAELAHNGHSLAFHGGSQLSFVVGQLSGTPDGLITWKDGQHTLIEIKSIDPRKNTRDLKAEPVAQHYAQVQQNMWLIQECTGAVIKEAMILYVNASDFTQMIEHIVPYDGGVLAEQMRSKADMIFSAESADELPAEGMTNKSEDCTRCAFLEECNAIQGKAKAVKKPESLPAFANRGIATKIRRYMDAKEAMEVAKVVVDTMGQEIKDYARENEKSVIESAQFVAKVAEVAGRKTLDVKAYEAATGVSAADYYKVGKPSLRLTVEGKQ